jgi:nitronate monooxygenase
VLMLGAVGALCGTAFYACDESLAHEEAKRRLLNTSGDDTVKGPLFDLLRDLDWPEGPWALRTLRNRHAERWANDLQGLRGDLPRQQTLLTEARHRGDFDIAPVIAGEAADLVHAAQPAGAVLQAMVEACAERLEAAARLTPSSHL